MNKNKIVEKIMSSMGGISYHIEEANIPNSKTFMKTSLRKGDINITKITSKDIVKLSKEIGEIEKAENIEVKNYKLIKNQFARYDVRFFDQNECAYIDTIYWLFYSDDNKVNFYVDVR